MPDERDLDHRILFLDPGKTTGYALFDSKGNVLDYGQITGLDAFQDRMRQWLEDTRPGKIIKKVVYEEYILDNRYTKNMNKYQKGGHQITLQVIGSIKLLCRMFNREKEEVSRQMKEAGYKHFGIPKAKDHKDSHFRDALAIGHEYFHRAGKKPIPRDPFIPKR